MIKFLQNFKAILFAFLLFTGISVFSQTTYDFTSGLTIYSTGGMTNNMAKFTVGGVEYTINGGINGSLSNPAEGVSNTKCLKKGTAGGDSFTLTRTDGQSFQFYGFWVKQTGMNSYSQFMTLPPFYTMTASDDCNVRASYTDNSPMVGNSTANTTTTYTWSLANSVTVKSVQISFKAALYWWIDNIIVGPALNNNPINLTTATATNITSNSALLGGNIISTDNSSDYGIVWSAVNSTPLYDYGADPNNNSVSASSGGNFSSNVTFTGVSAGSTIYYRAFSDNWNCGTVEYGDVKSLTLSGTLNTTNSSTKKGVSISPNPATNYFTVSGLDKKSQLQVLDANGKLVIEKEVINNENIKVEALAKGFYIVKINNSIFKLIKQ